MAKTAIVVVTAFAAHGLTAASHPAARRPAIVEATAPTSDANQRLPVQAPDGAQVTVRVGDLDLTTPAGAGIILRRIDAAAGQVCGQAADCQRQAAANAIASLSSPRASAAD